MNCQDITRFADTGSFSGLSAADRREAEAHARTCRQCAPVWVAHARLAELRIPAMPLELTLRARTLAALPVPAQNKPMVRRLTMVGCLVALGAAAGLLLRHTGGTQVTEPEAPVAAETATTDSTLSRLSSPPNPATVTPVISASAAVPDTPAPAAKAQPLPPLPLLPVPVFSPEARDAQVDVALQKAADQHPELVEGPDTDGIFAVGVTMREDGVMLGCFVKFGTRAEIRDADTEMRQMMPGDGGGSISTGRSKHAVLPNGRALRTDVSLRVATVGMNYDVTRSNVRVLQIVRDKYAGLMLPATGTERNFLTVFLSGDGQIQHEKIEHTDAKTPPSEAGKAAAGGDPNDTDYLARTIADRLAIDVSQIGMLGVTELEEGSRTLVMDGNGQLRQNDRRRVLQIYYAWARRATDAGPFRQQGQLSDTPGLDRTAAQLIVERVIPDAFSRKDPAAGEPTVVLTTKGEVIKAGRVDFGKNGGGSMDDILLDQLVPGIHTSAFMTARVKNNLGETANVQFAWEMPAEMAKAMDEMKARARAVAEKAKADAAAGAPAPSAQ